MLGLQLIVQISPVKRHVLGKSVREVIAMLIGGESLGEFCL